MSLSFTYAVIQWAKSKPASEGYEYVDFQNCAICQFLRETGRCENPAVSHNEWRDRDRVEYPALYHQFDKRVEKAAMGWPRTFGGFADRLAQTPPSNKPPGVEQ